MNYRDLMEIRRCYYIRGCHRCHFVLPIIAKFNLNLPLDKKIECIDASRYHDFSIIDNPKIRTLLKIVKSEKIDYPIILINGQKAIAPTSEIELIPWLLQKLHKDFIVPENNPWEFDKQCEIKPNFMGFGRKVVCK